ncbi:MAG: cation transporting ATPase C-terminal domain-containing protein, partial [Erysipelotrichales bacterium]|nr:cation transporting ATPase C-terminal domain-containing protein [Erysipelotrichales bacterium]
LGVVIQFLVSEQSFLQTMLKTTSLTFSQWGIVFSLSLVVIIVNEISKWIAREEK